MGCAIETIRITLGSTYLDESRGSIPSIPVFFSGFVWRKDHQGSKFRGGSDIRKDTTKLVPMLQQLGMRHVNYGLKPEYFNLAGRVLIEAALS